MFPSDWILESYTGRLSNTALASPQQLLYAAFPIKKGNVESNNNKAKSLQSVPPL